MGGCVRVELHYENARKNKANIQPSWLNKLGQQRIYNMAKKITSLWDQCRESQVGQMALG